MNVPYIPGNAPPPKLPLGRFLPPIPEGMISSWVQDNLHQGEPVLEPFGFTPLIPIEIALTGHPVLVTVNNPIHAFLLKVIASAPQREELITALQDLAVASKGDERMEPYIRSLYRVTCTDCHRQIEADAFLWRKGENTPYAALVSCPYCGARGEQTITEESQNSFVPLPPVRLHQARALNRITSRDDPLRNQVKHALNAYPARPLIVLQTIINKLESLEQTTRRRELLTALILCAADQGNTLWAYPSPRNRPRQIIIPSVYQERNLWKVMEEAIKSWQVLSSPIPLLDWEGSIPDTPCILRYQGRFKELAPQINQTLPAIVTAIPRPNQAFWTFSTLWTGWIWGQNAVTPIRQVLSRQRYDWNWHANALKSVFNSIHEISKPKTKFWGIIAENEPMLLLASLLAGDSAGFKLASYSQSIDDQIAQVGWEKLPLQSPYTKPQPALEAARGAISTYLKEKGEPASYQQIHTVAITHLANVNKLSIDTLLENPNQAASETNSLMETLFTEPGFLSHIGGGTASLESGEWQLVEKMEPELTWIDRIEKVILQHIIEFNTTSSSAVRARVNQTMPGIFTPEDEILLNCLESYADLIDEREHQWTLRNSEILSARKADMDAICTILQKIGRRLDYRVMGMNPIIWEEADEPAPSYQFNILSTAIITPHIYRPSNAKKRVLVIPGSRANLLAYKRQRDPLLQKKMDQNYQVMKYRLVRDLDANPLLSRELFKEQILADPPEYRASQLALF
jgi:hypothetical protein